MTPEEIDETCRRWEAAANQATAKHIPLVVAARDGDERDRREGVGWRLTAGCVDRTCAAAALESPAVIMTFRRVGREAHGRVPISPVAILVGIPLEVGALLDVTARRTAPRLGGAEPADSQGTGAGRA